MLLTSALAIFVLFWWLCLFLVLPFHARQREAGEPLVPGQADSAPSSFSFWRVAGQVTVLATLVFGLYYANYAMGWVTLDDVNPFQAPPRG
jgi:predicted secreted protein